jgi:hypothetical protein
MRALALQDASHMHTICCAARDGSAALELSSVMLSAFVLLPALCGYIEIRKE